MHVLALRALLLTGMALATPVLAQDGTATVPVPVIAAPAVAEAAPPTIEAIPREWSPVPEDERGRTAYGLFLSARSALAAGEHGAGAAYLAAAEALTPEQPSVREQALVATALGGDLEAAARIAPRASDASPTIREAGALINVVQVFADGDARAANAILRDHPIGAPHARAARLLRPWIAAVAGDWETALAAPDPASDPLTLLFGRYHRAQLLEHRRRYDEAEVELRALADDPRSARLLRLEYGEFLERRGRHADAVAYYQRLEAAGSTAAISEASARAAQRGRPPALMGLRAGAARALTAASAQVASEGSNEFAVIYLRLSHQISPQAETLLLLGQFLTQARLPILAREAFAQIPEAVPELYAAARVQIGLSLAAEDRFEEALAAYRQAQVAAPEDARIAQIIAAQLLELDRHEEALVLLNGPLLATADQSDQIRFMRGAAYESLGRIPEAEAELWAALQAEPDEPIYLNYLGYLWVDAGTRVAEGAAMIARAHAAAPENGNIQDSLGWAQYRQGQYELAVETLEQAVAKEPANAEINDHLGDAYWQVGRRREAGFQWTRVLTLEPDAERRVAVERKLAEGLMAEASVGAGT